ncbi:hypothetical protein MESS2_600022 [Mesorhizobium metallidurans STM 2683]|uniref:Uncharacterized protein n=1 Tax=Mesorhizobium metallidurans STM 2683 TaxID=1297569 RepID=M5F6N6_9HYPH|nr:hypothetical protein MESS2_600022 [Mesorhizobium metallidurans STM 2683]
MGGGRSGVPAGGAGAGQTGHRLPDRRKNVARPKLDVRQPLERFIVSLKRRTALSLCFCAIPKGKRYALFRGKPLYTFPGIAPE